MEHSIGRVARMAGVSARTLRHYDDVGLLAPSRTTPNGYRWYERPQLLRLQRILLLRELGVPLPDIRQILDGDAGELAALRAHREQLRTERSRLDQVIATVDRTISGLTGGTEVADEEFFTGLAERRATLRTALTDRFGPPAEEHFRTADAATADWSRVDYDQAADEGRRLYLRMSAARTRGVRPDADEALRLVEQHYQGVRALWPADAAAYHALGELVGSDPTQRAMVAAVDPELPPWLTAAIQAYAVRRLGHRES